ncbi:hypothetical protein FB451DRAFT_694596 [Mycena latifolia]|nr:hypothetical protein FB451DRAFT_694596 [Mycena latifolia]
MMRRNCWFGWKDGLTLTVVPLDTEYFPSAMAESLDLKKGGRLACGCIVSGLGCVVCGNALGARQNYCAVHSPSSAGRDGYVFLTTAISSSPRTSSSPQNASAAAPASSPLHDAQNDWIRNSPRRPHEQRVLPHRARGLHSAYPPIVRPPPLRSPTASSSSCATSAAPTPPARPVRRRTLRRPAGVELDSASASTSSPASSPAGGDAPRTPTSDDAALHSGGGGGGATSMSEYLRTLTAPAAQARAAQRLRDALGSVITHPNSTPWVSRPAAATPCRP